MSPRFFSTKSAPIAIGTKAAPVMLPPQNAGKPWDSNWALDRIVRDAFEGNVWAWRATNVIASNQAMLPILSRTGNRDSGAEVDTQAALLLNGRPNTLESAFAFRHRLSCLVLLNPHGAFIEIEETNGGDPSALWISPPEHTRPIPGGATGISGYEVQVPGTVRRVVPADRMVWIKHPHPLSPFRGSTPVAPAALSIDMDHYARLYNRNFLKNDGRPSGIVGVHGKLEKTVREELEQRLAGSPQNAGRVSVISVDAMEWIDLMTSPRDAQWAEGRKSAKEEILAAWGVPESKIGNAAERTFANAAEEDRFFWGETMRAHLALLASELDVLDRRDEVHTAFDTSQVRAINESGLELRKAQVAEVGAGLRTIDEFRTAWGMPALGTPEATMLHIPTTGQVEGLAKGRTFIQVDTRDGSMRLVDVEGLSPGEEFAKALAPHVETIDPETGDLLIGSR
jgi:HK97 family phage portal protein